MHCLRFSSHAGIIAGWLLAIAPIPSAVAEDVLTLEAALAQALSTNPALASAEARAQAMSEMPAQAGALPDPRLSLGALNLPTDTYKLDQEPMTQIQIGISQEFPSYGKRGLKRDSATHEAQAAGHEAAEARLRLARDVTSAWWQLLYLDRAQAIVGRNLELLRQFVRIAETKYKVGRGMQQDVLLAQLELSKLMDLEIRLRANRRGQEARLNALLNRSTESTIQLPSSVSEELPAAKSENALLRQALESRPLLRARADLLEAARSRLKLARKDYTPNFMVGAAYGFRDGTNANGTDRPDFVSLQLSFNLPLYAGKKQDKAVAQRAAEQTEHDLMLQDARAQVLSDIARYIAEYERARTQIDLFKSGIIPQASQTVSSMLAAYQVNKVDFLNLVRTQITLYNYETQYWQSLSEAHQALAALQAAVGKESIHD